LSPGSEPKYCVGGIGGALFRPKKTLFFRIAMVAGKKQKTLALNIDLLPKMTGFDSAAAPTPAHHRIVKHYASPLLAGPPASDLLLEFVMHMFTEDEADLVKHLPPLRPRTAEKVARLSGRSEADATRVLDHLALKKLVILAAGDPRKYTILPVVPGTFEMALMTTDLSTRNSWHKGFAELFERLFETGFLAEFSGSKRRPPVRYLPVGGVADTLHMAWPSDLLEEILEPYHLFAVGHCQCRVSMELVGKGCGRPTENCVSFGPMAKPVIERGMMRRVDRDEIIEIKRNAEREGCVTWMMNEGGSWRGNISCSCCGCCCHGLRVVRDFNLPGLISKPHFRPVAVHEKCTVCNVCVKVCPMDALSIVGDRLEFNQARCIGCGLCVVSCKVDALKLEPVHDARRPTEGWGRLLLELTPSYVSNSFRVWAKRLFSA